MIAPRLRADARQYARALAIEPPPLMFWTTEQMVWNDVPALAQMRWSTGTPIITLWRRLPYRVLRSCVAHELCHVRQLELLGPDEMDSVGRLWDEEYGYYENPLEVEAREFAVWATGIEERDHDAWANWYVNRWAERTDTELDPFTANPPRRPPLHVLAAALTPVR